MHSRILVGLVFTAFAYTLSKAAPTQVAAPVLHLTEDQVNQFKHADPNQQEPDIAFPKNVESLYAQPDAPVDDSLVGEVEADALDTSDTPGDEEEVVQEDAFEEEGEEEVVQEDAVQEDESVFEEDEAAAPAEEDEEA